MMYPQAPARHQGYNRMPMEIKGNKGENQLAVGFQETRSLREQRHPTGTTPRTILLTAVTTLKYVEGGRECDAPEVV